MKIVIAGAGEVGTHLAKMLSDEEQDITIMDTDPSKLAALDDFNLMTYVGTSVSFMDLAAVNVADADLFIACTPLEARNILACSMAGEAGAKRTVARINNSEYMIKVHRDFFKTKRIDHLIYPEYLAAQEIIQALKCTWARNWYELFNGELIIVGVKIRKNSTLVGNHLRQLGQFSNKMHVSAIKRNHETIIPTGRDVIKENDIVYIATTHDYIDDVAEMCGKKKINAKKVLVMGGGPITEQLLEFACDDYDIKVLEPDRKRCQELADKFPNAAIVFGDPRDSDFLEEEGIDDYDAFVGLLDTSEANILGCLMAKEHGISKTIAQVENLNYFNEAEALNIGTIINKKLLASSRIFQILLDSDPENSKSLALQDAEVAEFVVKEGAKIASTEVMNLGLGNNMTIAGMVRDGEGQLVTGRTRFKAGDHVVIFCLQGALREAEKKFKEHKGLLSFLE
ncbi:MAG: Trk system potassium transporter TrkA [Muribaculaceae bacterium]|nr:Trk system potassium transporter TrkA [Muribaculaceae bacterium]